MLQPIKLMPTYKDYIWGGKKLNEQYHKNSPYEITAESWEVSCHPNGNSVVASGEQAGKSLAQWIEDYKKQHIDVLGKNAQKFGQFPILIKLIDANDSLSIQVHPDDAYAAKNENGSYGKTEVWYIVDAEPNAKLVYGFAQDITKEEFRTAIAENSLSDKLNFVPVKKGDVFFVHAGLVHAIGSGILICEIQQNSDTTYRVYDWGRVGADGTPRPLHIDKAIDVSELIAQKNGDFSPALLSEDNGAAVYHVADCDYFKVKKYCVDANVSLNFNGQSFHTINFLEGNGKIGNEVFQKGDTYFVPAPILDLIIEGKCEFLITNV